LTAQSSDAEEAFAWASNNAAIATVDVVSGVVTGIGAGTAVITATGAETGAVGASSVMVAAPIVHEVTISPSEGLLLTGDTVHLTGISKRAGDTCTWSSSTPDVATISGPGIVSAVGVGKTTITAQGTVANENATALVTVVDPVTHSVTIQPLTASLLAGT